MTKKTFDVFGEYLRNKGLSLTKQRGEICNIFTRSGRHLSVDELHKAAKKANPGIGHTTVFRTLKLLCQAGIAREIDLGHKVIRYELTLGHQHHDHLVCKSCGRFIEAMDAGIEKLQERLCRKLGFLAESHKMEIYGICRKCRR